MGASPGQRSKAETLEHYKAQLLAAEYREAVLKRRVACANEALAGFGLRINPDPWSTASELTIDGVPLLRVERVTDSA